MEETLTLDQKFALSQLRQEIKELPKEVYDDTILLLKFLKARNFNIEQAAYMLKNNLRWKKEMQLDTLLKDFKPSEVLDKHIAISHVGYDKDGYPVNYVNVGECDGRGIFKSTNCMYMLKRVFQIIEKDIKRQESQTEKLGRPINQSNYIYNLANLPLSQVTHKQTFQNCITSIMAFQDNYPEHLKRIYVINASVYFTFIWPVVKKCLGQSLLEKLNIFGQDGWKEELRKIMDPDELPKFLGGNKTDLDGNPMCPSFIIHGGPVSEQYFLTKDINKFARKDDVRFAKIERQNNATVTIHITNWNSIINWEFELKSQDIGFGILLEVSNEKTKELIPIFKIATEVEPYRGMYRCQDLGKYFIVFDNTHSWFHQKEIYFRVWITDANEDS